MVEVAAYAADRGHDHGRAEWDLSCRSLARDDVVFVYVVVSEYGESTCLVYLLDLP